MSPLQGPLGNRLEAETVPDPQPPPRTRLAWRTVEVQGSPTRYGEAGHGPTVLFLHGWGLTHRAYRRALGRMAQSGVRVLAPALPGFGGTAPLPDERADLSGYAAWAIDFLDALRVRDPVIAMGHSFGGGAAIVLAHQQPYRVGSLVLINSIGASAWTGDGSTLRSMAERPLWDWGLHLPADLLPVGQVRRVLPVILSEGLPNLLRDPQTFWKVAGIARQADLVPMLEDLKARNLPVVVLWGRRDRIITRAAFDEMCAALGHAQVVTVDGSHSWLIADPETFGEVITNVVHIAARAHALGNAREQSETGVASLVTPAQRRAERRRANGGAPD